MGVTQGSGEAGPGDRGQAEGCEKVGGEKQKLEKMDLSEDGCLCTCAHTRMEVRGQPQALLRCCLSVCPPTVFPQRSHTETRLKAGFLHKFWRLPQGLSKHFPT